MHAYIIFLAILASASCVTSLKCYSCLPGGSLNDVGTRNCEGQTITCPSGDAVCINGVRNINGKEEIIRDCLSGSKFADGECVKGSTAFDIFPTDFCACKSDLCNSVANRPIQTPFFLVLILSAISLILSA